ncbi:methyl-accepting chemotaxis protein [Rhodovulum strictum]|nr:methyl-accepting chemotaxis protein [Rhodovulum strictum]
MAAMAAMTAAAVVIALAVFTSLTGSLNTLLGQQLPALRNSVDVIEHSAGIRDALSEMLLASTPDGVRSGLESFVEERAALEKGMNGMPAAAITAMKPLLSDLGSAVELMQAAIADRFARQDELETTIAAFREQSDKAREQLEKISDDAVYDMELAGAQTIEAVTSTLGSLIDHDFVATTLVLKARSEINLLSGIAIALADSGDEGRGGSLRGIAVLSLGELDTILSGLEENGSSSGLLPVLTEMRTMLAESTIDGFRARPDHLRRLMALREQTDAALTQAIDDLTQNLMTGAEDTATFNSEAVERLIGNELTFIRDAARLELAVETVVATAFLGATARDPDAAAAAQGDLDEVAGALAALIDEVFLTEDLRIIIQEILASAAPETGVIATRAAMLHAQSRAETTSRTAYDHLRRIGDAAVSHSDAALALAAEAGDSVLAAADRAERQLHMVAMGSVALLLAAPVFTWLLILRPMSRLVRVTERLSKGDLAPITGIPYSGGEIGRMATALGIFREGLIERARMQEQERALEEERRQLAEQQHTVVTTLADALQRLSAGDLTHRLDAAFAPDYEQLRHDFNATVATLNEMLGSIVENATEIHARAEEIGTASDDLSQRTENQAATLEETAAALDELTSSVRAAADGAAEVERVVSAARGDAEASGRVVTDAIGAMSEIKRSSDEIGQIIGVIDDIAFQTNLLALNAGVEAARAGEAGRGFAVVASEVRALAQRSSDAAKEIKTLIGTSSDQVESGVALVNRAGEALADIVGRVANIADLVSGIATGAQEQSVGLGEINVGVTQLDQVTQQNAAMVEEATAASATLRHEAETLQGLVARFRLQGGQPGSSTALPPLRLATPTRPAPPSQPKAAAELSFPAQRKAANDTTTWQDF